MREVGVFLVALALLVVACSGSGSEMPTSVVESSSTTTSTPDPSTTTTVENPSTTPRGDGPTVNLMSSRLYVTGGVTWVSGWVDRPAEVMVEGVSADTGTYGDGSTGFSFEVSLNPGEHEVEVVAVDSSGKRGTALLRVIVDPSFITELAFIQELDRTAKTLVADYVQWLTGEEAVAAAREDGFIGPDDELGNDFYIRNQNPTLRTLSFADDPVVVLTACYPDEGPCVSQAPVDVDTWGQLIAVPESAMEAFGWHWYGLTEAPYWITLEDGVVVQVIEQYVP